MGPVKTLVGTLMSLHHIEEFNAKVKILQYIIAL